MEMCKKWIPIRHGDAIIRQRTSSSHADKDFFDPALRIRPEYAELLVDCHMLQNLSANLMAVSVRAPVLVISSDLFAENSDEQRVRCGKRCSQGAFEALSPAQAANARPGWIFF